MGCSIGSVCYDQDYKEEDYDYQIDQSFDNLSKIGLSKVHKEEEAKLELSPNEKS